MLVSNINTSHRFLSVDIGSAEKFLHGGELPTLVVRSSGHAVHIFINGQLSGNDIVTFSYSNLFSNGEIASFLIRLRFFHLGSAFGTRENRKFTYTGKVNLRAGKNKIALLSVAMGLPVSI